MKKEIKPTFKSHKSTGLSAVGAGFYIEVKIKKKVCAILRGKSAFVDKITIQLAVKEESPTKSWKWIFLKNNCQDETEAKEFITKVLNNLPEKYEIAFIS